MKRKKAHSKRKTVELIESDEDIMDITGGLSTDGLATDCVSASGNAAGFEAEAGNVATNEPSIDDAAVGEASMDNAAGGETAIVDASATESPIDDSAVREAPICDATAEKLEIGDAATNKLAIDGCDDAVDNEKAPGEVASGESIMGKAAELLALEPIVSETSLVEQTGGEVPIDELVATEKELAEFFYMI